MEERTDKLIKIAVIGPESSGKTTLCEQLASHYKTIFVPEFARTYLTEINRPYALTDVLFIAKEQIRIENEYEKKATRLLFCDTNLITIKIWLDVKYNYQSSELDKHIANSVYDQIFLTAADLKWEADPLREHPHFREELFLLHKEFLQQSKSNFKIISGQHKNRLDNAIEYVNRLLK